MLDALVGGAIPSVVIPIETELIVGKSLPPKVMMIFTAISCELDDNADIVSAVSSAAVFA